MLQLARELARPSCPPGPLAPRLGSTGLTSRARASRPPSSAREAGKAHRRSVPSFSLERWAWKKGAADSGSPQDSRARLCLEEERDADTVQRQTGWRWPMEGQHVGRTRRRGCGTCGVDRTSCQREGWSPVYPWETASLGSGGWGCWHGWDGTRGSDSARGAGKKAAQLRSWGGRGPAGAPASPLPVPQTAPTSLQAFSSPVSRRPPVGSPVSPRTPDQSPGPGPCCLASGDPLGPAHSPPGPFLL